MKRTTLALLAAGATLVVVCALVGVRWASKQAPGFYQAALETAPATEEREEAAREFAEQTAELVRDFRYSPTWEQEFTQTQVNAWLAEDLPKRYGHRIPRGVSDPRVQFEDGLVRVGFHLKSSKFDGIVSLDLRPTVTGPNRLVIAVEALYAGLLPIAPASFTDDVTRQLDRHGVEHEWTVEDGRHLLAVTVVPNRGDKPVLEEIAVDDEKLRIAGHREQPATLTMREPAPAPRRM
jgi:hypothetical protein